MRKMYLAAMTAALAMAIAPCAMADDVTIQSTIGDGAVNFISTSEKVDITEEELTNQFKEILPELAKKDNLSALVTANLDATIKMDETNQMQVTADAIGNAEKTADKSHSKFHYSYNFLGQGDTADYETYSWTDNDVNYSATNTGDGWVVQTTQALEQAIDTMSSDENLDKFTLTGLQPNIYKEKETNDKYYICIYTYEDLLKLAEQYQEAEDYTAMAEGMLSGDINLQVYLIIDADTKLPHAVSIDASGLETTIPGSVLGAETDLNLVVNTAFATVFLDEEPTEIQIPDEVLTAPVQEETEIDSLSTLGEYVDYGTTTYEPDSEEIPTDIVEEDTTSEDIGYSMDDDGITIEPLD